jgi:hypothetical protein
MKNVHVLPTEKETRLFTSDSELILAGYPKTTFKTGRNIYITDDSEIEVGDWFLCLDNTKCNDSTYKCNEVWLNMEEKQPSYCKKIILTTAQDLIKDGVQAIDDEFLEWFVQNPTCEVVEVERLEDGQYVDRFADGSVVEGVYENYKVILPQDEAKQETLEEAAERLSELQEATYTTQHKVTYKHGFIDGAKWQAERMYSEEEVLRIIQDLKSYLGFGDEVAEKEWFNQFKKQKS